MFSLRKLLSASIVASCLVQPGGLAAQEQPSLDDLLAQLAQPEQPDWEVLEERIKRLWSRSGSASADYLLKRGRDAMEAEAYDVAVEHFTALTDHAPDFAEGWYGRASAFFRLEEYGLATDDLLRALALNPAHFEALTGLGLMLERTDRPYAALAAMEAAQALHPHHKTIGDAIARLERRLGRSEL